MARLGMGLPNLNSLVRYSDEVTPCLISGDESQERVWACMARPLYNKNRAHKIQAGHVV